MFAKTTDQVFEYRNMKVQEFRRNGVRYLAVTGCLVSTIPEKVRSVSVSFKALNSAGKPMGQPNGQEMMSPTQTAWLWSTKTASWTVPAATELAVGSAEGVEPAQWIEVTVSWLGLAGDKRAEVFVLNTTPKPLMGEIPPEPVAGEHPPYEPEATRADCQLVGDELRFKPSGVKLQLRLSGGVPVAVYKSDLQVPGYADMTNAWVTISAFDRAGNFIGADGGVVGGKPGVPPPSSTTVDEGFALRTADFSRVSKRTLLTFQWHDRSRCRWTENHFVDAIVGN